MSTFSKRDAKIYNKFRTPFQWAACHIFFGTFIKLMYDYNVEGKENIPDEDKFIVAANHISGRDPFLLPFALDLPIAFMAKEELFEKFFSRTLMDFTIKTALNIKNTKWMLGLFPQGTRDSGDRIEKITKGFASFAKATKTAILPVAIIGANKKPKWFGSPKLTVKVGKLIPYSDNIEDMMQKWCQTMSELAGKEYVLV